MSRHALRLALALIAVAPAAHAAQPNDVAQVNRVLDAFHAAESKADGQTYFGLFTSDGVFLGTDARERWTLPEFKAYAQPVFARGQGWTYRPRLRHVTIANVRCRCVAYFDEILDSQSYGESRGSGVLIKGPKGWKVAQYALTFPIPNDLAKGMTDVIKAYEAKAPAP